MNKILIEKKGNHTQRVRTKSFIIAMLLGPLLFARFLLPFDSQTAAQRTPFPDAHDAPLPGWSGPVFKLRQDYSTTPPAAEAYPWKQFDFKRQPLEYLRSVLDYVYEGNLEVNWAVEKNSRRAWYHVPWLHAGNEGREFVHGLTRERSSRPGELHPQQKTPFSTWAVSIYNAPGGYVIGRVWRNPEAPDPSAARFPDGTVAVKVLFTQATVNEVPYLRNTFEWQAHIYGAVGPTERTIQTVRLLQIDVAVRDTRTDDTTGWVFGAFVYDGNAPGATPWQRMVPLGLMWGNDPGITPVMVANGATLKQTFVNPAVRSPQHLGWAGRLNGSIDNPRSSCLSCHSTAQFPAASKSVPRESAPDAEKLRWFRNIKSGQPFDVGQQSLDYSLQLLSSLKNFQRHRQPPRTTRAHSTERATVAQ